MKQADEFLTLSSRLEARIIQTTSLDRKKTSTTLTDKGHRIVSNLLELVNNPLNQPRNIVNQS